MTRHVFAICLWVLAWYFAGFIVVAWFAARDGKPEVARRELACGLAGAAGFTAAGVIVW